jgi:DNA-binding Xre family transcriptional regulator
MANSDTSTGYMVERSDRERDRGAWSMLRTLLRERNLTVVDLHEMLQVRGVPVNRKSLYRLASSQPVQKLDMVIVRGICEALQVQLGELIQFHKPKIELLHLDPRLQEELSKLIERDNAGKLTEEEDARFNALLGVVRKITLKNAKMLSGQTLQRVAGHKEVMTTKQVQEDSLVEGK